MSCSLSHSLNLSRLQSSCPPTSRQWLCVRMMAGVEPPVLNLYSSELTIWCKQWSYEDCTLRDKQQEEDLFPINLNHLCDQQSTQLMTAALTLVLIVYMGFIPLMLEEIWQVKVRYVRNGQKLILWDTPLLIYPYYIHYSELLHGPS